MSAAVLVDTNVLVHRLNDSDSAKHLRAVDAIEALGPRRAVVSTQVLSEFANVMSHPRKLAMESQSAVTAIERVVASLDVLPVNPETVIAALHARERWQLNYYDAQIWATAALNDVPIVLSEDFSSGTTLAGVTFVDPFEEGFRVDSL